MLINQKAVKQYVKDKGKQTTPQFLAVLNMKVLTILQRAIKNANHHKRLTEAELL